MKRHVIHYSLFVISLCAPAYAQIAQRWISEASRPTAQEITIYRGETLALEPTITVHGTPYAWPDETEVTLWWQSSNMGASWWNTPAALGTATGALRAVWSPACDSGADRYTFFIRASAPSGIAYRASGTLIMRHSPGAVPNALPLPTPAIDFSSIEIHNAPWLLASDWQSGSNALAGAVQQAAQTMQADAQAALDTFAATNIVTRLEAVDGSQWIDGTGAVWRIVSVTTSVTRAFVAVPPEPVFDGIALGDVWAYSHYYSGGGETNFAFLPSHDRYLWLTCFTGRSWSDPYWMILPTQLYQLAPFETNELHLVDVENGYHVHLAETNLVALGIATQCVGRVAWLSDLSNRTTGQDVNEAIAAHDNAPAAHGPAFAAQRTGLLAQTSNIVNEAVLNITAPAILRDGVWYRQAWDTNLQTTVWEPRP